MPACPIHSAYQNRTVSIIAGYEWLDCEGPLLIAIPVSGFYLHGWLQQFNYRKEMSWWIFASAGAGALAITLITVSFQAIKAAIANPVISLRSE